MREATGEFQRLLAVVTDEYQGSKGELASAIGVTPSRFSHLLLTGSPSIEVCLRLAEVSGLPPFRVLRAAGKADIADLIAELYGPTAERRQKFVASVRLNSVEGRLLQVLRDVRTLERRAL